jgi:hypothetical protein
MTTHVSAWFGRGDCPPTSGVSPIGMQDNAGQSHLRARLAVPHLNHGLTTVVVQPTPELDVNELNDYATGSHAAKSNSEGPLTSTAFSQFQQFSKSCPRSAGLFVIPMECRPRRAAGFTLGIGRFIMFRTKLSVGMLVGTMFLGALAANEPSTKSVKPKENSQPSSLAWQRLKELVGEWKLATTPGQADKGEIVARYSLTAAGSAVVETLFPGGEKEMVTVYHLDGDQVMLTHYCCCGNQPRMRASCGDAQDELVFEFAGGTNLDPAKDLHMHGYRVRFGDPNQIHGEWEYYRDGKSAGKHTFDLVRKK